DLPDNSVASILKSRRANKLLPEGDESARRDIPICQQAITIHENLRLNIAWKVQSMTHLCRKVAFQTPTKLGNGIIVADVVVIRIAQECIVLI
ncbi:MAG: hypothetical protein V3V97_20125, partial [Hyphomicrobiaceae bacterium]